MGSYSRQDRGHDRKIKAIRTNVAGPQGKKKSIASLESLMRYKGSAYKLVILPMKKFPSVISLNLRGFLVDFQLAFTIRIHRANRKMF